MSRRVDCFCTPTCVDPIACSTAQHHWELYQGKPYSTSRARKQRDLLLSSARKRPRADQHYASFVSTSSSTAATSIPDKSATPDLHPTEHEDDFEMGGYDWIEDEDQLEVLSDVSCPTTVSFCAVLPLSLALLLVPCLLTIPKVESEDNGSIVVAGDLAAQLSSKSEDEDEEDNNSSQVGLELQSDRSSDEGEEVQAQSRMQEEPQSAEIYGASLESSVYSVIP